MKHNKITLFVFFFINILLRIPGAFFQELPPYSFCDEDIYLSGSYNLLNSNYFILKGERSFLAGGLNFYPMLFISKIISFFHKIDFIFYTRLARFLFPVLLSSLSIIFIYKISLLLESKKRNQFSYLFLFTFSPMALGLSRIYYPDHYIVFFASGILYFLVKFLELKTSFIDMIYLGFLFAGALSAKYTSLLFLVPICGTVGIIGFRKRKMELLDEGNKLLLFVLTSVLVILILNFSAILNLNDFISGFNFNLKNYNYGKADFNFNGILFYFSILFLTSYGLAAFIFGILGYMFLFQKKIDLFLILLIFPIFIVFFLGKQSLVINRNMVIGLPFVLVVIAYGFSRIKKNIFFYIFLIICSIEPAVKSLNAFINDFYLDSRVVAKEWIEKNIPFNSKIISNSFCFGGNPLDPKKYKVFREGEISDYDYYVFESWWDGKYTELYLKNPLEQLNYRDLHFLNFNARGLYTVALFSGKKKLLSTPDSMLIKKIHASGPDFLIFKNIEK